MTLKEELDSILTYGKTKGEWINAIDELVKEKCIAFHRWCDFNDYVFYDAYNGDVFYIKSENKKLIEAEDHKITEADIFNQYLKEGRTP